MSRAFAEKKDRAVMLMKLAAKLIRENCKQVTVRYDGADHDPFRFANDLQLCAEEIDEVAIFRDPRRFEFRDGQ